MKNLLFLLFFILVSSWAFSAETTTSARLKRSFYSVHLLDNYQATLKKLKDNTLVFVDPNSDFGDFDEENPELIKAKVIPYLPHIYFQFHSGKLFAISLFWDKKRMSYLELYEQLKKRYGKPQSFTASNARWEDADTLIILDNLPSTKYIDKKTFLGLQEQDRRFYLKDIIKDKILEEL